MAPATRRTSGQRRSTASIGKRFDVITSDNDNISRAMKDLVPEEFKDTNRFIDVVQWNLEWFGASKSTERDKARRGLVIDILAALNSDLFIFQEVAGPTSDGRYPGALDDVAEALTKRGVGDYAVFYTNAGGEQRVAMMYDREWLRAKADVAELFPKGQYAEDGKDPFAGRTPLHGHFTARVVPAEPGGDDAPADSGKFDFQVLGVHLKAMTEGAAQREQSAKILAEWLVTDAPKVDADVMIMGDWNAPPGDPCWRPIHDLEQNGKVKFQEINDASDFSYLWLQNRSDKFVSRIDLSVVSLSSMSEVPAKYAQVIRWKPIQKVIQEAGDMTSKEVVAVMKGIKEAVSDHMPTVNRFYFTS